MVSLFEEMVQRLIDLGFYDFFLPFILSTAIFYALLKKSKIISDSPLVNATLALSIAFLIFGYPVIAGISVGTGCGLVNGLLITRTGINAFVITLGTASVYTGMIFGFTHAIPFSEIPPSFKFIGGGSVFGTVPILFFIMTAIAIFLWFFFTCTVLGRRMLATGGNRDAARLSGINVREVTLLAHLFSGLFAGVSGVLYVARLGSAHPSIGMNWLLTSFAVPIIGGTPLVGGATSILGAVLGAVLITLISNALVLLRVDPFWEQFFLGLILLIAVGIDRVRAIYIERRY